MAPQPGLEPETNACFKIAQSVAYACGLIFLLFFRAECLWLPILISNELDALDALDKILDEKKPAKKQVF